MSLVRAPYTQLAKNKPKQSNARKLKRLLKRIEKQSNGKAIQVQP